MAKRSLRVLKRVSNVPSLGICESCSTQFSADPRQLGQAGVQQQFNAHECEAMQNAAPSTKEMAKKEAAQKEAVKKEAAPKEAVKKEAAPKEAVKKEAVKVHGRQ